MGKITEQDIQEMIDALQVERNISIYPIMIGSYYIENDDDMLELCRIDKTWGDALRDAMSEQNKKLLNEILK